MATSWGVTVNNVRRFSSAKNSPPNGSTRKCYCSGLTTNHTSKKKEPLISLTNANYCNICPTFCSLPEETKLYWNICYAVGWSQMFCAPDPCITSLCYPCSLVRMLVVFRQLYNVNFCCIGNVLFVLIQFSEYVHKSYINADIGNKYFYGTDFVFFFWIYLKCYLIVPLFAAVAWGLALVSVLCLTLRMSGGLLPLPLTPSWCG